jgi:hypothetical protein
MFLYKNTKKKKRYTNAKIKLVEINRMSEDTTCPVHTSAIFSLPPPLEILKFNRITRPTIHSDLTLNSLSVLLLLLCS